MTGKNQHAPSSIRSHPWREILVVAVGVCLLLAVVDWAYAALISRLDLATEIVDVQSRGIFDAKLDRLRLHKGMKVVLIGDSLIYGQSLEKHGDPAWREHGLSAQMQRLIQGRFPDQNPLVMNLGTDGMIPADMERIVREIVPCDVDLIILDLNMRSFSSDFSKPEEIFSREWIREMSLQESGGKGSSKGLADLIDRTLSALAGRVWTLYRTRELLQGRILDGTPKEYLRRLGTKARARLQSASGNSGEGMDDILLVMKSKNRYKGIHFASDNPQRQSLERMMAYLKERKQRTIAFYARESRQRIFSIINEDRYNSLRKELEEILRPYLDSRLAYLPGAETLEERNYLDAVHVDRDGYRILLVYLWPKIEEMLSLKND